MYQGRDEVCATCVFHSRCCQLDKGHARTINTDDKESLRQDMNRKMATISAQAHYMQRKMIVEPVFGQIKNSGFRGFSVRRKEKVAFVDVRKPNNSKPKMLGFVPHCQPTQQNELNLAKSHTVLINNFQDDIYRLKNQIENVWLARKQKVTIVPSAFLLLNIQP